METDPIVMDLTIACVTSAKNATGLELDLTQDTLPILDHYAQLPDSPREEVVSLLAPMCGAYLGELVRRALGDGRWDLHPDDHAQWRMTFDECSLTFNPIGVALEVLLVRDAPGWGAHLQATAKDLPALHRSLEVFGDVRDRDFYTFAVRYEAIEQVYLSLLNDPAKVRPKG